MSLSVGNISGAHNLTKAGAGVMTLPGSNTYAGNTYVSGGTLQVTGSITGAAAGSQFYANGGAMVFDMGATGSSTFYGDGYTVAMQVGNGANGAVTLQSGTLNIATGTGDSYGSINLAVNSANTGTLTVNGGVLNVPGRILIAANSSGAVGTLTINGGAVNLGTPGVVNHNDPGQGNLWMGMGTATVNLNGGTLAVDSFYGSNTTYDTVNFNGGTLQALANNATFDTTAYAKVVQIGGAIINTAGYNITFNNPFTHQASLGVTADGGLTKLGAGMLTLSALNTYTGGTRINSGTLSFANGSLSSGTVAFTGNSTLQWYGGNTQDISSRLQINDGVTATFDTNGNSVTLGSTFLTGAAQSGAVAKVGSGLLVVGGSNTYSGGTTVSNGTLQLASSGALGTGGLTANNGTVDLASFSPTVTSLSGSAGTITVSGASNSTLTVNQAGTTTFGGSLNDGAIAKLGLVMNGNGTLDLTGASSMGIHTDVNGGVLQVDGSLSVPIINVNNGARLAGSGTINLTSDGIVYGSSVGSTFNGQLAGNGGIEVDSGSLTLTGSNGHTGNTVVYGGTLVAANGSNGSALGSGTLTLNGGTLAAGPAGGTISGLVQAGNRPHTIAPGAGLSAGQYGILNLNGGLITNASTTLSFNLGARWPAGPIAAT